MGHTCPRTRIWTTMRSAQSVNAARLGRIHLPRRMSGPQRGLCSLVSFLRHEPDLVAEPSPFTAATRYAGGELPVETGGQAEFVAAYGTDAGFADVFQLKPVAGRLITPDEFRTKATVAVVSEGFAVRHFGEANR